MIPMFIQWLLTGSKILSILGRVDGLSDMVPAAEAAPAEPFALPPLPIYYNYNDNLIKINHKH